MDPITIGALIAGLVSLVGIGVNAAISTGNRSAQERQNAANIRMQQATNQQNEQLTREAWDRDDNSVQRRAQDLAAAGLAPQLAAGSAAGVSQPIKAEAPQGTAPQMANIEGISSLIGVLGNLGPQKEAANQTRAQTDLIRQQVEASKFNMVYMQDLMEHRSLQNDLITQQLQQGSSVLRNMQHDYEYAVAHGLPVGRNEDTLIRRFEYTIDQIKDLIGQFDSFKLPSINTFFPFNKDGVKDNQGTETTSPSSFFNWIKSPFQSLGSLPSKISDFFKGVIK